ncbi:polyphosphate kinase 1 [Kolteria novifilia]|uniref:polyphosphate kinase 1 n=1 Tax=Kolteria novifilia TaxID=2527975 RepID=UPI003AF3E723
MNRDSAETIEALPEVPEELSDEQLDHPSLYINRELSWLEFNRRVLEEARDRSVPLLERLKFLAIFSQNLDEFFMVRVGNLKQKIDSDINYSSGADRMLPREQMALISQMAHEMVEKQYRYLLDEILPPLAEAGIEILTGDRLTDEQRTFLDNLFSREVFPVLTPLALDLSHPFPHLTNGSSNMAIRLRRPKQPRTLLALVQLPSILPRFVNLPSAQGHQFLPLERVIRMNLDQLFPGMQIVDSYLFRVTRDADFDLDDYAEIKDLAETIERQIRERRRGVASRLEIGEEAPEDLVEFLRESLHLEPGDVYRLPSPLDLTGLFEICSLPGAESLKEPEFVPRIDPAISGAKSLFAAIRESDLLLHHPYDSFKPVVDFISAAATDPKVLAIKQTLYRTSSDSPIVAALQEAAHRGKQVSALVELQARMDEERNILWARELEKAGVHVVYGFVGLKTHCKVCLVVRRDDDKIRRYLHLSTGNYNPQTARVYTDLGLFTCNDEFADDASALFNYLTGYCELPHWKKLIVAPSRLRKFLIEKIESERQLGKKGRIVAKINAILEPTVIQALYRASRAGVSIDLVCRGICGLRPGIPGLSENIRVHSVVDRFLEHSRIYYFGQKGHPEVYIASADWMDRNLVRRLEVAFPIEDARLKARVIEILNISLLDNVKSRRLESDGIWRRYPVADDQPLLRSQSYFLRMAQQERRDTGLEPALDSLPMLDTQISREELFGCLRKNKVLATNGKK